jgi:hypothetical protein
MYKLFISVDKIEDKELKNVYYYLQHHDEVTIEERRFTRLAGDEVKTDSNIDVNTKDIIEKSE